MKVGYFPCTQDPPNGANIGGVLREAIVEAQVAEESGFDSCLFSEHHQQEDCYIPNVILMAGMVGVCTKKIKVGTCVTLIPLWHPVHAAEDAAIVDQITGGRMILSVGVGYQDRDFEAFGLSIKERAGRSEEGVEVIKKCWEQERFSYHGKFYNLDNVMITPKPFQKPRPPIWMAAWSDVGIKRVGADFGRMDHLAARACEGDQTLRRSLSLRVQETRQEALPGADARHAGVGLDGFGAARERTADVHAQVLLPQQRLRAG